MADENVIDIKKTAELKAAFDAYQTAAMQYDIHPKGLGVILPTLGLAGEAGEVCEKVKKILRDSQGGITKEQKIEIAKEMGDVLWYLCCLARDLGIPFHVIPLLNIAKLQDRAERGTLRGSGDNR